MWAYELRMCAQVCAGVEPGVFRQVFLIVAEVVLEFVPARHALHPLAVAGEAVTAAPQ